MNHEKTHQTNPMAPWDPLDALSAPWDPLAPPIDPLRPINRSLGLIACLYVTGLDFFIFTILTMTNDFDIDWELAGNRKSKAYGIFGYGAVTSFLFIIGCLVKYFGILRTYKLKKHHKIIVGYTYKISNNSSNNKSVDEGSARIRKLKNLDLYIRISS